MTVRVAEAHEADEILRVTNAAYQVEKFFIDTDRLSGAGLGSAPGEGSVPGDRRLGRLRLRGTARRACLLRTALRGPRAPGIGNRQATGESRGGLCPRPRLPLHGPAHRQSARRTPRLLSQARLCARRAPSPSRDDEPTKLPCHLICMSKELISAADERR